MNQQEAVAKFISENLSIFTTNPFDKGRFKTARKHFFFEQHSNRFGSPSNRDYAQALVAHLRKRGLSGPEIVGIIDASDFMRELGESYTNELKASLNESHQRPVLSEEQILTLKTVGALDMLRATKEKELVKEFSDKQQALKQELETLEAQRKQKQQEYDAVPSILEKEEIQEPEMKSEVEVTRTWWERFYLTADPFPRTDGLSLIPVDLYEQIISKTRPFVETLSSLQKDSDCLFHKGFLLVGDYGYGKTTFVDYLSHYLITLDILPIRITCARAFSDSAAFADSFYQRLMKSLRDEAAAMTTISPESLIRLEPEDVVVELTRRILASRKKGVVVFLDDYHKHKAHFTKIYEFLGTLQVLKDTLTRENLNVGFIVSGTPEWRQELSQNGQLHGFLDGTPIIIPHATADFVCEVFNRRIKAYCYESTPRLLRKDFVQKLVRDSGQQQGVRDYLNSIVTQLSQNNLAIIDSPVVIEESVLSDIRSSLEHDPLIAGGFNKLLYQTKFKGLNDVQIARCLELLVQVGTHDGITENDRQFLENRFFFKVLRDCELLQKQRSGMPGVVAWGLRDRLKISVKRIQAKHKLHLNDYLLKIYAFKDYHVRKHMAEQSVPASIKALKDLLVDTTTRLPQSVVDQIGRGLSLYERLLSAESVKPSEPQLKWAEECLTVLSEAVFGLDTSAALFGASGISGLDAKWRNHPCKNEQIDEAIERLNRYSLDKTDHNRSHAVRQVCNVVPELADTLRQVIEDQCQRLDFGFLKCPADHTEDEIQILSSARDLSYSGKGEDHFTYVKQITDHLEIRFRQFFYVTGNLLFGDNYFACTPPAVIAYAQKNLASRQEFSAWPNSFLGITRSQYRQMLCQNNPYKEYIISALDLNWKEEDWKSFGEIFALENIMVAHNQLPAYSPSHRDSHLRYVKLSVELLSAINRLMSRVIEQSAYVCTADVSNPSLDESLFRISFKSIQIRPGDNPGPKVFKSWPQALQGKYPLTDHILTEKTFNHLHDMFLGKIDDDPFMLLVIDPYNLDYTQTHYRAQISEIISTISYMRFVSNELSVLPWFGGSIALRPPTGKKQVRQDKQNPPPA